jgi:valyl-tRNA synthetase
MDINPGKPLTVLLQNGNAEDLRKLRDHDNILIRLARLDAITVLDPDAHAPESALALVGDMRILIPLAGLIDKDAELKRLTKEIDKLGKELQKSQAKLNNPSFLARARPDVVEREQQRVNEMAASLQQLETQAAKIRAMAQ